MGSQDSGIKSCISTIGTLVGIAAGLVSVIRFFYPDSESFLQAFSEILSNAIPLVSDFLANLGSTVETFVDDYPSITWISAVVIILVTGVASFWIEDEYLFDSPFQSLLALSPLAFIWIWLFSSFASTFGLIMFVIGFLVAVFIFPFLDYI